MPYNILEKLLNNWYNFYKKTSGRGVKMNRLRVLPNETLVKILKDSSTFDTMVDIYSGSEGNEHKKIYDFVMPLCNYLPLSFWL